MGENKNYYYEYIDNYYRKHGKFPDPETKEMIDYFDKLEKQTHNDILIMFLIVIIGISIIIYSLYEDHIEKERYLESSVTNEYISSDKIEVTNTETGEKYILTIHSRFDYAWYEINEEEQ